MSTKQAQRKQTPLRHSHVNEIHSRKYTSFQITKPYIMDPPTHIFFFPYATKDNVELVFHNLKIRLTVMNANQKAYCNRTKKSPTGQKSVLKYMVTSIPSRNGNLLKEKWEKKQKHVRDVNTSLKGGKPMYN